MDCDKVAACRAIHWALEARKVTMAMAKWSRAILYRYLSRQAKVTFETTD